MADPRAFHGPRAPKILYPGRGSTTSCFLPSQTLPEDEGAARLEEDEAAADAEGYGFGAGGGAEFAEDGGYVELGGVVGDVEAGGDFLVGQAGGEHLQDFALAAGEGLGEFGGGLRGGRSGWKGCEDFGGMQDTETGGCSLQGGGKLIGGDFAGE